MTTTHQALGSNHRPVVRADDMPDDCHDHCAHAGVDGIYFPYVWCNGQAWYVCRAGHMWTCWWGHREHGSAPQWLGRPYHISYADTQREEPL